MPTAPAVPRSAAPAGEPAAETSVPGFAELRPPLTYAPERPVPVGQRVWPQARFAHLAEPGAGELVETIQRHVDEEWAALAARCETDAAGNGGSERSGGAR